MFALSKYNESKRKRCLIGCSGSVATVKVPELTVLLSELYDVVIVTTKNARFFLDKAKDYNPEKWEQFVNIGGLEMILEDKHEWDSWNKIGDPVLHIELRRWADLILIAPASADLLSKASVGITDNFLLSIMRAWDFTKPCLLCPAMNTFMWSHPSTETSLSILESWGWQVVAPVEKKLACNDVGSGALAPVSAIIETVKENIEKQVEINLTSTTRKVEKNHPYKIISCLIVMSLVHVTISRLC